MTNVLHKELIGDMSVKETVTAYRTSFFRAFGVVLYAGVPESICCLMGSARMRNSQFVARCFCYLTCFSCAK